MTVVTSAFLVINPSDDLFARVRQHFGTTRASNKSVYNYDMDIINMEFSCHDNVLVLPKTYCTLDSEFSIGTKLHTNLDCRDFASVNYMHFSAHGKPFSHGRYRVDDIYSKSNFDSPAVLDLFRKWFRYTHKFCGMIPTLSSNVDYG